MKMHDLEIPLIRETCDRDRRAEVKSEVKKQLWLAGPMIAGSLLQNVLQMISVMFVGHLGELSLSGASMASSFADVTGYRVLVLSIIFAGHLGENEISLSGASMATSFTNSPDTA